MKKLLALLLALSVVFIFAACGKKAETPSTVGVAPTETGETKPVAESVAIGNIITTDFAEITVDEAGLANDIQTSIKTGSITYTSGPDSSADKEFVYIRGSLKYTGKSSVVSPNFLGSVEVDGYSYDIDDSIIESNGSSVFTLEPLMTYQYTLYAEIPNELAESFDSYTMNFGFEEGFDNTVVYTSSGETQPPEYNYTIEIMK